MVRKERGATFTPHAILTYGMLSAELIQHLKLLSQIAEASRFSRVVNQKKFMREMVVCISAKLMKMNAWIYEKGIRDSGCLLKTRDASLERSAADIDRIVNERRNEKLYEQHHKKC